MDQGLFEPQLEQKLPVFTVPQEHVQLAAGLGCPQLEQKLPLLVAPQEHVQLDAEAGAICGAA